MFAVDGGELWFRDMRKLQGITLADRPDGIGRVLAGLGPGGGAEGGAPEQIVLGNSTSYGLHLVANGLPWRDGDEVLVIEGDYPATILPWQRLTARCARTRAASRGRLLSLGTVCRQAGMLLVVNGSQAVGARPIDVATTPVDALICCGYKWLCGSCPGHRARRRS